MYGYTGKIAKVNLTSGQIEDFPMSDKDREKFLGGKTLAAKIIFDSLNGKIQAFSDENIIVITTSPLTGSTSPCSSRFNVSTISPLTNILASSNCGGSFGLHLKRAGFDGLVICGKSQAKVYLDITDGIIKIKNAEHLWGKNTSEVQELLGPRNRGKFVIGIAGENMVRYASVVSEERTAGRAGIGAVFGYKNLKGIAAGGESIVEIYNKEKFKKHNMPLMPMAFNASFNSSNLLGEVIISIFVSFLPIILPPAFIIIFYHNILLLTIFWVKYKIRVSNHSHFRYIKSCYFNFFRNSKSHCFIKKLKENIR